VLVCPACQADHDWTSELDRCRQCGSWRLVRQLGQVSCRSCGATIEPDDEKQRACEGGETSSGLAAEVDAALSRMWGKPGGR
jgi:ribosomal protein L40E